MHPKYRCSRDTNHLCLSAAHLGGFGVRSLRPAISNNEEEAIDSDEARLSQFKEFMVSLYNQTGVKGEKVLLFLSDDRLVIN